MFTSLSVIIFDLCSLWKDFVISINPFQVWWQLLKMISPSLSHSLAGQHLSKGRERPSPPNPLEFIASHFSWRKVVFLRLWLHEQRGLTLSIPNSDFNLIFYLFCLLYLSKCVRVRVCVRAPIQIIVLRAWCSCVKIPNLGGRYRVPLTHLLIFFSFSKHVSSP